jgi:glycosyltransferase involved in cell wall biosynthesis
VQDGVNGLLVEAGDTDALADALVRLLTDGELVRRLAAGAEANAGTWTIEPDEFARRVGDLVGRITHPETGHAGG